MEKYNLKQDEFGRLEGVLPVYKPKWKTSHDMVDIARKKFGTRKIGHAGTLDPFAEGVLILLVGKSTKLSESLLNKNKEYEAEIIFGYSTETGDVEGEHIEKSINKISRENLEKVLETFRGEQLQYVPIYSSVKVNGDKLRNLARQSTNTTIKKINDKKIAEFEINNSKKTIEIPRKNIRIFDISLLEFRETNLQTLQKYFQNVPDAFFEESYQTAKIKVKCSKGTYIRQLAMDIGEQLGTKSMLINLIRTASGEYTLEDTKILK